MMHKTINYLILKKKKKILKYKIKLTIKLFDNKKDYHYLILYHK